MNKETITKFNFLKKVAYERNKHFQRAYEAIRKEICDDPDFMEGLSKAGFSEHQVLLIVDLILREREEMATEIFSLLSIYTMGKTEVQ